jgi:uncharacterized protein (TIGR03067 family)
MTRCALLVLVVGLLAIAGEPKEAATKELKKLEGKWVLASGINDGKELPEKALEGATLTIEGNKHTVKFGGKTYKGTHKVDPSKSPKTIDITDTEGPFKDKTVLGIYRVTKDEFKICYAPPGKDRPSTFFAKAGSGHRTHTWKREKK